MPSNKQLVVSAIKDGTVLDHIPASNVFKVMNLLGLQNAENQITVGFNLESGSLGRKGIIKVAGRFFKDSELNRIALVAPLATVNIIKDYEVVEKKTITLPDEIIGMEKCANPLCVTNHQPIKTKFAIIKEDNSIKLACHYCEKVTEIVYL